MIAIAAWFATNTPTFYKYRRWIGYGALMALCIVGYLWFYYGLKSDIKKDIKIETIEKTVTTRTKQNEVRNNRVDDDGLINSLQSGTF